MTSSQLRSQLLQIENRRRQAVNNYNQAVRQHNQKVRSAVDGFNRVVRAHNARVRADRHRVAQALARLQSRPTVQTHYVHFGASVETLHRAYETLDRSAGDDTESDLQNNLLDLSERENANSLEVMDALLSEQPGPAGEDDLARLRDTRVGEELRALSPDMESRWRGALFSLHPQNPDAARHFCTSAREIFATILEQYAPDEDVKRVLPNCSLHEGRPTRRARIQFALTRKGLLTQPLEEFIDEDVDNIVQLFRVFNDGTHGSAGRFQFEQLRAIKARVEDGIAYLSRVFG